MDMEARAFVCLIEVVKSSRFYVASRACRAKVRTVIRASLFLLVNAKLKGRHK